jgi:hypothetical protein
LFHDLVAEQIPRGVYHIPQNWGKFRLLNSPATTGQFSAWISSQTIYQAHSILARFLGLDRSQIRVHNAQVGGGFGAKVGLSGEEQVAARLLEASPADLEMTRSSSLLKSTQLCLDSLWLTILSKRGTPTEMTLAPPGPSQQQQDAQHDNERTQQVFYHHRGRPCDMQEVMISRDDRTQANHDGPQSKTV